MIGIGRNILSTKVQRNLAVAVGDASVSSERLSSGQRINKASDDAAGLAIATSLNKDRILANAARRNIGDGVSVLTIVSSGIASQKDILVRMQELATQAASGSYSDTQRQGLQREYSALLDEYDRIGQVTQFNGVNLLRNSSSEVISLAVGITGSDSSLLTFATANNHRFAGTLAYRLDYDGNGVVNSTDQARQILGTDPTYMKQNDTEGRFQDYAVFQVLDSTGQQATVRMTAGFVTNFQSSFLLSGSAYYSSDAGLQIDVEPTPGFFTPILSGQRANGELAAPSASASVSTAATSTSKTVTFGTSGATATINLDLSGIRYRVIDWSNRNPVNSVIGFTNVETIQAARRAVDTISNRRDEISAIEGRFGAIAARLQVANNVIGVLGENFALAASRIQDADVALEAANSIRSNIKQETAAALLGQANQEPFIALDLLQRA